MALAGGGEGSKVVANCKLVEIWFAETLWKTQDDMVAVP